MIRRARPEDAEALHAALADLARHLGCSEKFRARPADYVRYGFRETRLFNALIAEEEEGDMTGVAVFFPEFSTMRGRPGVYLQDLWVDQRRRGAGIGRRLLAAVLREAEVWGAVYMKLATDAENDSGVRFYRGLGFTNDEGERVFLVEGAGYDRLKGET